MNVLIIDNYDSFTFNLFHLIGQVAGTDPTVVTNDGISLESLRRMRFGAIVISPGPGHPRHPRDFGVCSEVITDLDLPVLGVCLGHQGIAWAFGATVGHAPEPMHGRTSEVFHDGLDIFEGIPSGFRAVRYHSLMVSGDIPGDLIVNAWTDDGVPMAIRHRSRPLRGVQFHPESILTEHGHRLIRNFLDLSEKRQPAGPVRSQRSRPTTPPSRTPDPVDGPPEPRWRARSRRLPFWVEPEDVFCARYGDASHAFWLDSSLAQRGLARFSFMGDGSGPECFLVTYDCDGRVITVEQGGQRRSQRGDIFEFLRRELRERVCEPEGVPFDFNGGFVGWFGYGLKDECGFGARHRSPLPDAAFLFADRVVAFDHEARAVYLVALERCPGGAATDSWFATMERELRLAPCAPPVDDTPSTRRVNFVARRPGQAYLEDIGRCLTEIRDGESYEICLTNTFTTEPTERPLDLYRILRRVSPAPYAAYLRMAGVGVLSSSPERFLRVDRTGAVSSKPIKGTAPRAVDEVEDDRLKRRLAARLKDSAENLMIVDLIRNDLGRVCQVGSVRVPTLMDVESYATVHQLVSTVTGQCRPGVSAVDCVRAAFPGGSMTGAPKARTIEILDRLETGPRGIYSGSIGWLGVSGAADLSIVIRTAVVTATETSFGVGGAIVALSDPTRELEECVLKGAAIIRSILLLRGVELAPERARVESVPDAVVNRMLQARAPAGTRKKDLAQLLGSAR